MNKCPFCPKAIVDELFHGTKFLICDECGLLINKVFPSKEVLKGCLFTFMLSTVHDTPPGKRGIASGNERLDVLEKYMEPGIVYDVAASGGFFMKAAFDRGWEVYGNEISQRAIGWAMEHYNIHIMYGFLEDIGLTANHFDAVVLWNSLEHMYDPKETLDICRKMLKPHGLIYIRVPDKQTYKELIEQYEPLHLYEFTGSCLAKHLESLGFEEVKINPGRNPDSGVFHCDFLYRRKK